MPKDLLGRALTTIAERRRGTYVNAVGIHPHSAESKPVTLRVCPGTEPGENSDETPSEEGGTE